MSNSKIQCKICKIQFDEVKRKCDSCSINGCNKCIKTVCCDCGAFMCKECRNNKLFFTKI